MLYLCDTCHKVYKYRKNLLRHMREKHDPTYEYFCCTENDCERKFIRRDSLSKHLQNCHGYTRTDAVKAAVDSNIADQQMQDDEFEDISADDTVFDLIEEYKETQDSEDDQPINYINVDDYWNDLSDISSQDGDTNVDLNNNDTETDKETLRSSDTDSDVEIHEISDEELTAIVPSDLKTRTQTVTLTFERITYYVDGVETSTENKCYQDYYELFA